jgi:hypothetical protein
VLAPTPRLNDDDIRVIHRKEAERGLYLDVRPRVSAAAVNGPESTSDRDQRREQCGVDGNLRLRSTSRAMYPQKQRS